MKTRTKVLIIFMLFFCVVFTSIGYAEMTDSLIVSGNAELTEPQALFITEATLTKGTNARETELAALTLVDSSIVLDSDGTAEMSITVKNNTDEDYGFNAVRYAPSAFSNPNISVKTNLTRKSVDNRGHEEPGTVVAAGASLTFTVTFTHNGSSPVDLSLISLINYEFLPYDSISPDIVDSGVANDALVKFEDVLNNVDDPDSYQKLVDQMAKSEETDRYSPDYIANFDSAHADDKAVIEELFGTDSLKIVLDGVETEVRLIIKKENVTDLFDGDEFTVYITTHSLLRDDADREGFILYSYYASPIYAAVYTADNGSWSMIGDMYTGRGKLNKYSGGSGEGSFDTGTWESTQAYGSAQSGSSIEEVLEANIRN